MEINDPIYGDTEITEPVLEELIATPAMQRLKGVDQNVTAKLIPVPWKPFTRFDHCVGVMLLIKHLGGDLEEQVAGLLHDVSHTAFSHVIDFVFNQTMTQGFHEEHLERIVKQSQIPEILAHHGFDTERIINHKNFSILEQALPALCADRIDYALKTFYAIGLPRSELHPLFQNLTVFDRKIAFTDQHLAQKFADTFLRADREVWGGSAVCNLSYHLFARVLKRAYENGEVTFDDFFTTDREVLEKLSPDSQQAVEQLRHLKFIEVTPADQHDYHVNGKIRYVDPPVLVSGQIKILSEINPDFKSALEQFLARRRQGNYVKILS